MKIIIFGAAGDVGRRIVSEALTRGHAVTCVVRTEARLHKLHHEVNGCVADASDPQQVAHAAKGQDLLISALRPSEGQEDGLAALTRSVLDASAAGQRVLLVGGAARLRVPGRGGETVLTAPGFLPADVVPIARACQAQYELCLAEHRAAWTYISPPAMLNPGKRTGSYRLGTDTLVVNKDGESCISMEDYAVAILDEAEKPQHFLRAFTVGY